jgi:hypothetical protein
MSGHTLPFLTLIKPSAHCTGLPPHELLGAGHRTRGRGESWAGMTRTVCRALRTLLRWRCTGLVASAKIPARSRDGNGEGALLSFSAGGRESLAAPAANSILRARSATHDCPAETPI